MEISVCTTNYNCAHALGRHLESVYRVLAGLDFEYIVVDNRSTDQSWDILRGWNSTHPNMRLMSKRCTMGAGRQIGFAHSSGRFIVILDTDVVYDPILRLVVDRYLEQFSSFALQALYCGIFPRAQWAAIGGRRSLNTNEDVDMWIRLWRLGSMRWYPVPVGTNFKDSAAAGSHDYLSRRYPPRERIARLLRREWDLLKTRDLQPIDLEGIINSNTIDLGLVKAIPSWPQNRTRQTATQHLVEFVRLAKQVIRTS
ncbi:MAG TPA: glycosyltransferase family A protein [Thermoplasmata archaeon]|nr:glycosyltransferase family A protein [Thermoplasmata archaeon]